MSLHFCEKYYNLIFTQSITVYYVQDLQLILLHNAVRFKKDCVQYDGHLDYH